MPPNSTLEIPNLIPELLTLQFAFPSPFQPGQARVGRFAFDLSLTDKACLQ